MPPPNAPPAASTPGPGATSRSRWVVVLSSLGALLVMLGLVALAIFGGEDASGGRGHEGPTIQAGVGPPSIHPSPPLPAGCVPDPEHPPKLVMDLDARGVDFGKVKQGQVLERKVTFRSVGAGPLCIRELQTGCGCVKAHLDGDKRRYESGETGTITLVLDSAGRSGLQDKAFTVVTNELVDSRRTWPVRADISLGVVASSNILDLGRPRKGEPSKGAARLSAPKADAAWKILDVIAKGMGSEPAPAITWTSREIPDPTLRVLELEVTHPGRDVDGLWRAPLIVKLDHPDRTEVTFEATLNVVAPVQATPPMAIFGFLESGTAGREVRVMLRPATAPPVPFHVLSAEVVPSAGKAFDAGGAPFLARVDAGSEADRAPYAVSVRYDGRTRQPGPLEADLVIRTDVKEQPEIRVPLRATLTGRR
jgi:hypothetical protein